MKTLYEAVVTSSGGRDGYVKSSDGLIDFPVRMPKELGGKGGATNPEQLFAAGYSACFENAILHVARGMKIQIKESKVTATVGLSQRPEGGFQLSAKLVAELPQTDRATAEKLLAEAHRICPYSNATRGNVDVQVSLA